jgi:3-dehydroquinate synthase
VSTVQVLLADRSYAIRIEADCLRQLGAALKSDLGASRALLLSTPRVARLHGEAVASGLASAGLGGEQIVVPDGEAAKTLRTAERVYDRLLELGAERGTFLVGLGGGALCDLAGFAASTFMRGMPVVQAPTTLLAQVDASVGGKTAVNHRRGKNLIGTFYQPRLVWIDPAALATLPAREFRSGLAEVIKVAAIWDAEFFGWLERSIAELLRLEPAPLAHAITRAVQIKAEVVGLDERESGLRALLNFGHTLGHAIEAAHGYRRVRHGEAVAMGMVFAARLSHAAGLAGPAAAERLERLLSRAGLPTQVPDWSEQRETYLRAIAVDKKVRDGLIGMVLLEDIGRATVRPIAPASILQVPAGPAQRGAAERRETGGL